MLQHNSLATERGTTSLEYLLLLSLLTITAVIGVINSGYNEYAHTFNVLTFAMKQVTDGGGTDEGNLPFPNDPGGANDPRD